MLNSGMAETGCLAFDAIMDSSLVALSVLVSVTTDGSLSTLRETKLARRRVEEEGGAKAEAPEARARAAKAENFMVVETAMKYNEK